MHFHNACTRGRKEAAVMQKTKGRNVMIAVIGLIMFAVSSYLALSKKMHLMVPFVVVPVIAGLFCGFSLPEVLNFAAEGVTGTFNSVLLCIFAVLYFSVLSETGMLIIMVNPSGGVTMGGIFTSYGGNRFLWLSIGIWTAPTIPHI